MASNRIKLTGSSSEGLNTPQVVIALKNLMSRVPPTPRGETAKSVRDTVARLTETPPVVSRQTTSAETTVLRTEVSALSHQIQEKDEELARLRAQQVVKVQSSQNDGKTSLSAQDNLESERIAISDLLSSLEDRYASGEISIFEYSHVLQFSSGA